MNTTAKQQTSAALGNAMEARRAFSWTVDRPAANIVRTDVVQGVYHVVSQAHFQTYGPV